MEVDAQVLVHGHSCSRIVVGRGVVRSGEQRDESAICEELGTILDHLKIRDDYSFQKSKQKLDLMSTNDHVYVQLTADVGHHVLAKHHACSSEKCCKNQVRLLDVGIHTSGSVLLLVFRAQGPPTEDPVPASVVCCRSLKFLKN